MQQKRQVKREMANVYDIVRETARTPSFFDEDLFTDDLQGRFEALVIIMTCVLFRLNKISEHSEEYQRQLQSAFISDLDMAFREQSIGDAGVSRRVTMLSKMFYGRLNRYWPCIEEKNTHELAKAIQTNVYEETDTNRFLKAERLSKLAMNWVNQLDNTSNESIIQARFCLSST